MAIVREQALAHVFEPLVVTVERGRLQFFARTIGETDPAYWDVEAARRHGHPDLPVPPTFFFSLEMEMADPFGYLSELGIDLRAVLHAEQEFVYHQMAYAGDTLTLRSRITDVYSKKGGALEFLVRRTELGRDGTVVAESIATMAVRQLVGASA